MGDVIHIDGEPGEREPVPPAIDTDAASSTMAAQPIEMANFDDVVHFFRGLPQRGRMSLFPRSRRGLVLAAVLLSAVAGAGGVVGRLSGSHAAWIERVVAALFIINFAWISALFWNAVAGFIKLWFGWKTNGDTWPDKGAEPKRPTSSNDDPDAHP